jgi:streptogramin lyase
MLEGLERLEMPNVLANPLANASLNELLPPDAAGTNDLSPGLVYETENLCLVSREEGDPAAPWSAEFAQEEEAPSLPHAVVEDARPAEAARDESHSFDFFDVFAATDDPFTPSRNAAPAEEASHLSDPPRLPFGSSLAQAGGLESGNGATANRPSDALPWMGVEPPMGRMGDGSAEELTALARLLPVAPANREPAASSGVSQLLHSPNGALQAPPAGPTPAAAVTSPATGPTSPPSGPPTQPGGSVPTPGGTGPAAVASIVEYGGLNFYPAGLTAGPELRMWFRGAQTFDNAARIKTDGTNFTIVNISGSGLAGPATDIVTGPDGRLWCGGTNYSTAHVQFQGIDPSSDAASGYMLSGSGTALGLAAATDGNIWFTVPNYNFNSNVVGWFNPNTGASAVYNVAHAPGELVQGPDNALWVVENGYVARVPIGGGTITEYPVATSGGEGICVGPDGALWFAESGPSKIGRITTAGAVTEYAIPTLNASPSGITAGPDGALWFTEGQVGGIGRVTTRGAFTEYNVPSASSPTYIAAGPDGNVWFTETGQSRVGKVVLSPYGATLNKCSNGRDLAAMGAGVGAAGAGAVSTGGVRYADGAVTVPSADLSSGGFGTDWGQSRSWTNVPGAVPSNFSGAGVTVGEAPYLLQLGSSLVALLSNGTTARLFDQQPDLTYRERFFGQDRLSVDANGDFLVSDSGGDVLRFGPFNAANAPLANQSLFKSFTDPYGNVTSVTAWTTVTTWGNQSVNRPGEVRRSTTVNGTTYVESYLYSYLLASDPNKGLLQSVVLRRSTDGGTTWSTVRQALYSYYATLDVKGNLGDLHTAQVEDGAGNVLDTSYYRYYRPGEAGGYANNAMHGLKYAFGPQSYARLVAALGSSIDGLSDAAIAPYADNYYQYDAAQRVTQAVVQGQGCSVCSGGLGTYTYAYAASGNAAGFNSWTMKTTETLPDGNTNTVYTNAYDEVMLKVYTDASSGLKWDWFNEYDGSGRVILQAGPSAVPATPRAAPTC